MKGTSVKVFKLRQTLVLLPVPSDAIKVEVFDRFSQALRISGLANGLLS